MTATTENLGATVGFTVSIGGMWRAVAHHTNCVWYKRSRHTEIPIPKNMPVKLCRTCKPTLIDVMALADDIWWYPYSPSPGFIIKGDPRKGTGQSRLSLEVAEAIVAQRSMGWNRKGVYQEGWD
jgi:hypothetical protein